MSTTITNGPDQIQFINALFSRDATITFSLFNKISFQRVFLLEEISREDNSGRSFNLTIKDVETGNSYRAYYNLASKKGSVRDFKLS